TPTSVVNSSTVAPQPETPLSNAQPQILALLLLPLALFHPITIKFERNNYSFWKSQILPTIRAHELEDYLFGARACPPQYVDHTVGGPKPGEPRQIIPGYVI
ncbi:hypothetical protein PanWU01x14_189830, partial [Parasponia andersonii]